MPCVHLLTQVVEPLYQLGVGADAQVRGLLQEQLLVNQIAQQVLLVLLGLRFGGSGVWLLVGLVVQLLARFAQISPGHDAVVDARDYLFHNRVAGRSLRLGRQERSAKKHGQ